MFQFGQGEKITIPKTFTHFKYKSVGVRAQYFKKFPQGRVRVDLFPKEILDQHIQWSSNYMAGARVAELFSFNCRICRKSLKHILVLSKGHLG